MTDWSNKETMAHNGTGERAAQIVDQNFQYVKLYYNQKINTTIYKSYSCMKNINLQCKEFDFDCPLKVFLAHLKYLQITNRNLVSFCVFKPISPTNTD